ncbi:hypothetical protein [Celeribacter sp. SCSIO 80788]|uniref:hypothetical protein n=1 Tax=Celeribacter sp. SCSIO 80788 TaxID=3117013 RepID=UPI003DA41A59
MADMPTVTRGRATELSFSHFICTLGVAIEAERDIEGPLLWADPGFADWLRDAELAWETATNACYTALDRPPKAT